MDSSKIPEDSRGNRLRRAIIKLIGRDNAAEFAKISGIHRSTIYQMLKDDYPNPGQKTIDKLKSAGINPNYFLYGAEPVLIVDEKPRYNHLNADDKAYKIDAGVVHDAQRSSAERVISQFLTLTDYEKQVVLKTLNAFWESRKES